MNKKTWEKLWSAKGSLYFDSNLGDVYTKTKCFKRKSAFSQVIFFYSYGITDCWVRKSEINNFGERLKKLQEQDNLYVKKISKSLIDWSIKIKKFIKLNNPKKISTLDFYQFWQLVNEYYIYHICVKYIADYISGEKRKNSLVSLEKARIRTEGTYPSIERYMSRFSERVSFGSNYSREMILSLTKKEMQKYLGGKKVPKPVELRTRYRKSALLIDTRKSHFLSGQRLKKFEHKFFNVKRTDYIQGRTAFGGKVKGFVRVVSNPLVDKKTFEKGNILVTGMTRPEFLAIAKRSAAIITDSGGVLSHASILARELKIPCIVGAKIATKVLKDGDLIEVNADEGVVKIVKRK